MIHVSGGDAERDFEDDHLARAKLPWSAVEQIDSVQPKEFREIKAYLPIKSTNQNV